MVALIVKTDLPTKVQSAELVDVMVAAANAKASRVAPCLTWDGSETDQPAPSEDQLAEAKLVLIGMVVRWNDAGSGALSSQVAGPFQQAIDTRQRTGFNPWPSEIEALQEICNAGTDTSSGAFSITPAASCSAHMPWCNIILGANWCSCGADLTNYEYPLYEGGVLTGDEY